MLMILTWCTRYRIRCFPYFWRVNFYSHIMNILKKKILDDFDNKNLSCQCNLTAQIDQCRIIYRYNNLVTLLVGGYGATFNNSSAILWAIIVVIVWYLDLQLPVQLVPITTKVVCSNPVYGEVYSIQQYVTKLVSGFLRVLRFTTNLIKEFSI
jgi:hypothetical protein